MITKDNWQTELQKLTEEAEKTLIGSMVEAKNRGQGMISTAEIVFRDAVGYIRSNVSFTDGSKSCYNLNLASKTGTITGDAVALFIADITGRLTEIADARYIAQRVETAERQAEWKRLEEEKKEADKLAREEEKYQARVDKVISDLNSAVKSKGKNLRGSFYHTVGWLAANTKSISATIPDFTQKWFEKTFGPDMPKTVVDSRRKTSGGYSMKWNPSFRMSVKGKTEDMSADVKCLLNGGNTINNTAFIFDLVHNYGFRFGKAQDIGEIIKEIPADRLSDFMAGYNGGNK